MIKYFNKIKHWLIDDIIREIRREGANTRLYNESVMSRHVSVEFRSDGLLIKTQNNGILIPKDRCQQVIDCIEYVRKTNNGEL